MFWVIVLPLVLGTADGKQIEMSGLTDPAIAYADNDQCDAIAGFIAKANHRAAECRPLKIESGRKVETL